MPPLRRDRLQGLQHKAPPGDAGMGQQDRPVQDGAGVVQQIQVQAARRVGNGTLTPEGRFDFMQKCQQRKGLEPRSNRRDGIQEWRGGRIGPRLGFIKGRNSGDFDSRASQRRQGRMESFGGRARPGRNIGANTNEDWA